MAIISNFYNFFSIDIWVFVLSKEEGKYQESIQSNNATDPGHHMGNWQHTRKHHIQESQEESDHKAARNRQDSKTNMKHK